MTPSTFEPSNTVRGVGDEAALKMGGFVLFHKSLVGAIGGNSGLTIFDNYNGLWYGLVMIKQGIYSAFGSHIRQHRLELGLSLDSLSERSGLNLSRSALSTIEQGKQQISLYQFIVLCNALDLSPDKLITQLLKGSDIGKNQKPSFDRGTREFIENI